MHVFELSNVKSEIANKTRVIQQVEADDQYDAALIFMSKLYCSNKRPYILAKLVLKGPSGKYHKIDVVRKQMKTAGGFSYIHFIPV